LIYDLGMPARKETWPIEALPHEEALIPVVESFLAEGCEFDFSQSGMRQLYDRIDELAEAATKANLLDLVSNILGELDCLAICTSGVIEASDEERPAAS
jgi:hypothetical protein